MKILGSKTEKINVLINKQYNLEKKKILYFSCHTMFTIVKILLKRNITKCVCVLEGGGEGGGDEEEEIKENKDKTSSSLKLFCMEAKIISL